VSFQGSRLSGELLVPGHEGTIALLGGADGAGANLAVGTPDEVSRSLDHAESLVVTVESHFH
jgi:hypothetical protein